jgi:hypothetical protein
MALPELALESLLIACATQPVSKTPESGASGKTIRLL